MKQWRTWSLSRPFWNDLVKCVQVHGYGFQMVAPIQWPHLEINPRPISICYRENTNRAARNRCVVFCGLVPDLTLSRIVLSNCNIVRQL